MSRVVGVTCVHGPRAVTGPGFEALLTANGNWTLYLTGSPGQVFSTSSCPGCGLELWGLPGVPLGR